MKVTFSVIKTWYCCKDGEACKRWDVVNWVVVAKQILTPHLSPICRQTVLERCFAA